MARSLARFASLLSLPTFLSLAVSLHAQTASIVPIELPGGANAAAGNRVSDDGVVVGDYHVAGSPRAFRWSGPGTLQPLAPGQSSALGVAEGGDLICGVLHDGTFDRAVLWTNGVPEDLGTLFSGDAGYARAHYMTANGSCIVGIASATPNDHAFRVVNGTMQDLGEMVTGGFSSAEGASADGSLVVGKAWASGWGHAFRWRESTNVMEDLGTIGGVFGESIAWGVSDDGSIIVGMAASASGQRAFVFTDANGMQALPSLGGDGSGSAFGVSADGSLIAGGSSSDFFPQPDACFWKNGQVKSLGIALFEAGVDMTGWQSLGGCRCSPSGEWFTGWGTYNGQQVGFRATLGPVLDPPRIDTWVTEGSVHFVRVGQGFQAPFVGTEADGNDLTIGATGLPADMQLTPPSGTTGPSPMNAQLTFAPGPHHFGAVFPVSVSFQTAGGPASTRTFTIVVPANQTPTVGAMAARSIECLQGHHEVELASVVSDPEGFSLNVTWKVDGVVRKTQNGVASGSQVAFAFDYDHGPHTVTLEARDGYATGSAGTTVTVEDTLAPIVVVAPDVTRPTDPGKDFATYDLPEPTVFDASGHPTTLESDAPSTYLVGETIVTWTATDEKGNEGTATQKVIVEDREAPVLTGVASVRFFVDPGEIFSTQQPPTPTITDNVDDPDLVELTDDAPEQFPVGTTKVTFTATDAAGNSSTFVTKVRVDNRRPVARAGADVVVTTRSESGIKVTLDGSASSDADGHALKFLWTAPGVTLAKSKTATPSARFPVGTTTATLKVTDPLGLTDTDRVRVIVKLRNARPRARGSEANRTFAAASSSALRAAGSSAADSDALSGAAHADLASAYGAAAGAFVRWEEGQSEVDASVDYATLRFLQQAHGDAAARDLFAAYCATGDEGFLAAYRAALLGTAFAGADLSEP